MRVFWSIVRMANIGVVVMKVFHCIVRMANIGVGMQNIGGFGPGSVFFFSSRRVPNIGVRMQNIGSFWS